jgi:plastocyanin
MFRQHRIGWTVSAMAMVGALLGCGGGGSSDAANAPADAGAAEKAAPAAVADAATLNVAVNFTGAAPAAKAVDMSEEKACADKHAGGAKSDEVVVNNGKLQNVFVYVKEGLSGTHAAPAQPVVVDQNGCVYQPHVAGMVIGQKLVYRNSDGVLHNVKAVPKENRGFNISQPSNGDREAPSNFQTKEVMVPVECNVHGWMKSYVGVLDHPYFAVSGADGSASIGNLPPGTYTIEAWHEKYGVKSQQVTVGPNETKAITFDFSAASATAVPLNRSIVLEHTHAGAHAGGR